MLPGNQFGLWLSLVERLPRVQEAAGSNPASPIANSSPKRHALRGRPSILPTYMALKIKLLFTICFVFGLALASPCRAWQTEIPADMKGICLYMPDPDYPPQIYHRGIAGRGIFRINIDLKTGRVSEVKVIKSTGYQILNELAAKAFLQWRFKPGTIDHWQISYEFGVMGGVNNVRY